MARWAEIMQNIFFDFSDYAIHGCTTEEELTKAMFSLIKENPYLKNDKEFRILVDLPDGYGMRVFHVYL